MARSKKRKKDHDEYYKEKSDRRSLGMLYRAAKKTNPKAPAMTGKILIQRHTLQKLVNDLQERESDEVEGQLAGWPNRDRNGKEYLTVELSSIFRSNERDEKRVDRLDFIFDSDATEN